MPTQNSTNPVVPGAPPISSAPTNPLAPYTTVIQNGVMNPSSMKDSDFENTLSGYQKTAIGMGKNSSDVESQLDSIRDARSQKLNDDSNLSWGQQILKGAVQPVAASGMTVANDIAGVTGVVANKIGDLADKLGLSGLGGALHDYNTGVQQKVYENMEYGESGGVLGNIRPAGAAAYINQARGKANWLANVANASLDVTGNFAQAASLAVGGGETGAIKTGVKIAGMYAAGQMAKEGSQGASASQIVSDGMTTFLGGVATGGLLHLAGAGLGSVGSAIANTSLGRSIVSKMGSVLQNLQDFTTSNEGSPRLIDAAYAKASSMLQTAKAGLSGLYFNQMLQPEEDMITAQRSDISKAQGLIYGQRNNLFGQVFSPNVTFNPQESFGGTMSDISDIKGRLGIISSKSGADQDLAGIPLQDNTLDRLRAQGVTEDQISGIKANQGLAPDLQRERGSFASWLSSLQSKLSKGDLSAQELDQYVNRSGPPAGLPPDSPYTAMATQVKKSLRSDFESMLRENHPDLVPTYEQAQAVTNRINDQYKTGSNDYIGKGYGEESTQSMASKMVNGEITGDKNGDQVSAYMNSLSPAVKTNFKSSLVNTVAGQAWDMLNNGRFSDDSYQGAAKIIGKFLDNFQGTSALDPSDHMRLAEWEDMLSKGGVPDVQGVTNSAGTESVTSNPQINAQAQEVISHKATVDALAPVIKSTGGDLSTLDTNYSKMAPEKQNNMWESISDPDGKKYIGSTIFSQRVGRALDAVDPNGKVSDLSGIYKAVKSIYDDRNLFTEGFDPGQQATMNKLMTFMETQKDLTHISMTKAAKGMVGGVFLSAIGHPVWGTTVAARGALDTIRAFMENSRDATPKMQALLNQARGMIGEDQPKMSGYLNWISNLLKSNTTTRAATATGASTAATAANESEKNNEAYRNLSPIK